MPTTRRPVLVTRPAGRADALVNLLEEQGLVVEHRPLVRLTLEDSSELTAACGHLAAGAYTHLVITSRTAVEALLAALPPGAPRLDVPATTRVLAVGAGTAEALSAAGAPADLVAAGSGAALVEAMPPADGETAVLFPASAAASPTVPEGLAAKGYRLDRVTAYRPELLPLPAATATALRSGGHAAIVLTSPMIARAAAGTGVHASTAVVTIGTPTEEAARTAGLLTTVQADEPTDEALVRAVLTALDSPHPCVPRSSP
ncbi:uroporphyrinogen-III synthase [Brachybacterium sacelli]|uniref:Uroporphyrinogen-III synthase n=2 Tax=Brachybacterium sacelli TaxID=173364 RepID=A0ABS4X357_9MICO|nr:uroporphyrinogen-III synthase [Brachybacterium sacelli]MBP2382895.1 uroporphyrinogen-III synthase [Brachybacterium sacelli]